MFSAVLQHFFPKVGENITAFFEEQKLCIYMASSYGYKYDNFIAICADAFAAQFKLGVFGQISAV
jgi:hypothetical protein